MKNLRLLLCLAAFASAKSADDYFHGAGYKYIAGKHQEASVEAEEGLRAYPEDPHLQGLAGLLKKMKDQQKQDQNQEGGGDSDSDKKDQQDKQEQKDKPQDQKGKDSKDNKDGKPEEKPQDKNGADSTDQGDKKQPESADQQPPRDSTGGDPKSAQQRPKAGQMSKEEAEQLLNSFADDEKKEQRKLRAHPGKHPQVEQDW